MSPPRLPISPPATSTLLLSLGIAVTALGCGDTGVVEVEPEAEPDTLAPGLELQVVLTPQTAQTLAPLGWSKGVPGVTISYSRVDNGRYVWTRITTDEEGSVFLGALEPGDYWFAAERALTANEVEALPATLEAVGVLAGAPPRIRVAAGERTPVEVRLHLDEPGTLVISEVQMNTPESWETGGLYRGGGYMELYNNSEDVVYLDGMILGMAYDWILEADHHPCAATRAIRTDSTTLWADVLWRFPGSGADYPVGPGETVLIAASATDHRDVHPSLVDLREADFELQGLLEGGADNPGVPNLEEIGPTLQMRFGFRRHKAFWYLAAPVGNIAALPSTPDPGEGGRQYLGIPAELVLDVAMLMTDNSGSSTAARYGKCDRGVAPVFDQLPGGFFDASQETITPQRRVVKTLDGRRVLLDTNTSAVDFVLLPQSPGRIPEPEGQGVSWGG